MRTWPMEAMLASSTRASGCSNSECRLAAKAIIKIWTALFIRDISTAVVDASVADPDMIMGC